MNLNLNQSNPYPIHCFPAAVRYAAQEVIFNTKAPDALIGMEILTNMAVTAQALYDVRLPHGQIEPTSLFVMHIAESGERMTAIHKRLAEPLYQFDLARLEEHKVATVRYEQDLEVWQAVLTGLRRKLSKEAQDQEDDGDGETQQELAAWIGQKPLKPRQRRLMRQNVTERALMDALDGDGETVAFISDEGEIIIKGGALNKTGYLNKAWDGASLLTLDRSDGVSVVAKNPRVTVAYKAQPGILQELLDRRGDVMRSSGHLARYLLGCPTSTQGTRFSLTNEWRWNMLEGFHARMQELLTTYESRMQNESIERTVLHFSEDAKAQWLEVSNRVECMLAPCGYLHDIKDFASKSMAITGRVAALLHLFGDQVGEISLDTFNRAVQIVDWHLHEFKKLFSPECRVAQHLIDAQTLADYLRRNKEAFNFMYFAKNHVLRTGPVRPSSRFEAALEVLLSAGQVRIVVGQNRQKVIELNTACFGYPRPQAQLC